MYCSTNSEQGKQRLQGLKEEAIEFLWERQSLHRKQLEEWGQGFP